MTRLKIVKLWECDRKKWEALVKRSELDIRSVLPMVKRIISDVKREGDGAILKYTKRFDGVKLRRDELKVREEEFKLASEKLDPKRVEAIQRAANAIKKFHLRQMPKEWMAELSPGVRAGQLVRPLESVGVYVPGGLARYPSSLLMAAVPAKVAGVKHLIVCTPTNKTGEVDAAVLAAAEAAGVDSVFKLGGSQAIAAMAYGTQTVPRVEKIVGPGNVYVAAAKLAVASDVDIDFVAGPSEILVVADDSAPPEFVAADLVSQAEHGQDTAAVLVTTSQKLASKVQELIEKIIEDNPRKLIVRKSLRKYGLVVLAKNMREAVEFSNTYAPEHLVLMVKQPRMLLKQITNAGSIFLGSQSPVAAGDFAVGPNHILPTGGVARRRSGLSVLDFLRLPTVQELSRAGLKRVAETAIRLAEVEGLPGHARSIMERLRRM